MIKSRRNRNFNIPHTVSEIWTFCFSSYKNRELKVKLWWAGARERKKSAFFVTFICPKELFLTFAVDELKFSSGWNFILGWNFFEHFKPRRKQEYFNSGWNQKHHLYLYVMICKWKPLLVKKAHVIICLTFTIVITKYSEILNWAVVRF